MNEVTEHNLDDNNNNIIKKTFDNDLEEAIENLNEVSI